LPRPRASLLEYKPWLAGLRAWEAPLSIAQEGGYFVHLPEESVELPLMLELSHVQLEEHSSDGDRVLVTEGNDLSAEVLRPQLLQNLLGQSLYVAGGALRFGATHPLRNRFIGSHRAMAVAPTRRRVATLPEVRAGELREVYPVPPAFRPARDTPPGRFGLLEVFKGIEKTPAFQKYPGDDRRIREIAEGTRAHISDGPGWMYVAPPKTPPEIRAAGFRMVETPKDVIVVSRAHLAHSPRMDLYLDILHEFLHILQRKQGREIWPRRTLPYEDRPTEVEAYAFSIAEARRLGVPDRYLREYLRVTWLPKAGYLRLLRNVGVSPGS
jgi:hypothetical protein